MSVFKLAVWLHKGPGIVNLGRVVFFELGLTGSALDPSFFTKIYLRRRTYMYYNYLSQNYCFWSKKRLLKQYRS